MTYWTEARHGKNIQANDVPDILDQEIRDFTVIDQFIELCAQLSLSLSGTMNFVRRGLQNI